jgi:putative DNA primase/helicase
VTGYQKNTQNFTGERRLDALRLLTHLFEDREGRLCIATGKRNKAEKIPRWTNRYFEYPREAPQAVEFALGESGRGREAYFCSALLESGENRTQENVLLIPALYMDGDGANPPADYPSPTAIVETSRGKHHYYWKLREPVPGEGREEFALINRRLTYYASADKGGHDVGQILRVPGSTNYKPENDRFKVSLIGVNDEEAVNLEEFASLPPVRGGANAERGEERNGDHRQTQGPGTGDSAGEPPVALDDDALEVWEGRRPKLRRDGSGLVDRSESLPHIARVLYDTRATRPTIVSALEERDRSLGWNKYIGRSDQEEQYHNIVDLLEKSGRNETVNMGGPPRGSRNGSQETQGEPQEETGDEEDAERGSEEKVSRRVKISDEELFEVWRTSNPYIRASMKTWLNYGPGYWVELEEEGIRHSIWREVRRRLKNPTARRTDTVYRMARDELYLPSTTWDGNPNIIVLKNQTLDISGDPPIVRDHSPEDYALSGFEVDYDPEAKAPIWEEKVLGRLQEGEAEFLEEYLGYCLTPDTSLEKAVWLLGEPGSGRSTFIEPIEAMFGERSTVVSLRAMTERFGLSNIPGKTLLLAREQPSGYLPSTDILNSIISGETLDIDVKNKQPFKYRPTAKILWAMNNLPSVRGVNEGLFRRVYVVSWPAPIKNPDPKLKAYLIEHELAGIFNGAVRGLARLRKRGKFDPPSSVVEATKEFEEDSDLLEIFIEDKCRVGDEEEHLAEPMHNAFLRWCERSNQRGLGRREWNKAMRRRGFKIEKSKKGGDLRDRQVVYGVSLRMGYDPYDEDLN